MRLSRIGSIITGFVLISASLAVMPGAALAAPTATDDAIASKRAERDAVLAELETSRAELVAQVSKYVSTGKRISEARDEVTTARAEALMMDAKLNRLEATLQQRAVQLYRTDRVALMEIVFGAESVTDLLTRFNYVIVAGQHDMQLLSAVREARQQNEWQQQRLNDRIALLTELQTAADQQREEIERVIDEQEQRAESVGADLIGLMRQQSAGGGSTPRGGFEPDAIISQEAFRDSDAMTLADVQLFLERQGGTLDRYEGPDHAGETKSAAQMIVEAAANFHVNPMVLLITMQKEQSLLSRPASTRMLDWAMGCGKMDSGTISRYRGFGNQVWYGAKSLDTNARRYRAGISVTIDSSRVFPVNGGTYALYRYTPHYHGNVTFWLLYWRYFGDPLAPVPAG